MKGGDLVIALVFVDLGDPLLVLVLDVVEDPVDGVQVDERPRAAPEVLVVWVGVGLRRGKLLHLNRWTNVGAGAGVALLSTTEDTVPSLAIWRTGWPWPLLPLLLGLSTETTIELLE